jgi:hypothetical protein
LPEEVSEDVEGEPWDEDAEQLADESSEAELARILPHVVKPVWAGKKTTSPSRHRVGRASPPAGQKPPQCR